MRCGRWDYALAENLSEPSAGFREGVTVRLIHGGDGTTLAVGNPAAKVAGVAAGGVTTNDNRAGVAALVRVELDEGESGH